MKSKKGPTNSCKAPVLAGGQGVLELVVAIGVIALVLGGVVTLLVQVMGARGKSFDRKKATRLASVVMESLVEEAENNPGAFWELNEVTNGEVEGFDDYRYLLEFSDKQDEYECARDCTEVTLSVGWSGSSEDLSVSFRRFFSK